MKQIASIHINTDDPKALGEFYKQLMQTEPAWASDDLTGFMLGDFRLEVARHDAVSGKNKDAARLFFDLLVEDVRAEFTRTVALGASIIQEPYEFTEGEMQMVIATLADPDGNYFQLVSLNTG